MYNLLMSGADGFWDDRRVKFPRGRFLEHTDELIKTRYEILSGSAIDELKGLPTLLAYELHGEGDWHLARIVDLQFGKGEIDIEVEFDASSRLSAETMAKLAVELGIGNFEQHRTHWAIKDLDLADILGRHDLLPEADARTPKPHQKYTRKAVLAAGRLFQHSGHAELDDLLAEIGIDEIEAGRGLGGRQARATALASWALRHPDATTAEGLSLWEFLVKRAAHDFAGWSEDGPPQIAERHWLDFKGALEDEGYSLMRGSVFDTSLKRVLSLGSAKPDRAETRPIASSPVASAHSVNRKVFVVHGRNATMKEAVAHYLLKIGLEPVILHDQPNKGRTLFTKFQEVAQEASFAVVLLYPDDLGNVAAEALELKDGGLNPRARQNVILELGFFIGKLGSAHVAALVSGSVEKPSDFDGVLYIPYSDDNNWRELLLRELKAANVPFDPDRVY